MSFYLSEACLTSGLLPRHGPARLVAVVLAMHAKDHGGNPTPPGIARISECAGISENAVRRAIDELVKAGVIHMDGPVRGEDSPYAGTPVGGRGKGTLYRFDPRIVRAGMEIKAKAESKKRGSTVEPFSSEERVPRHAERVQRRGGKGSIPEEKGSTVEPESINYNPSTTEPIEQSENLAPQAPSELAPQGGRTAARTRRGRIPDDFELTPERMQAAVEAIKTERGINPDLPSVVGVFEDFRDHYQAECGPRAMQADWDAGWRRWAVKHYGPKPMTPGLRERCAELGLHADTKQMPSSTYIRERPEDMFR